MRKAIIGYIVVGKYGAFDLCAPYQESTGKILLSGDCAHVFADRRAARKAIRRTLDYAEAHRLDWDRRHRIYRLTRMTAPGGGRGVGRCVRCGLATTRLVTRDLGVHAACEPVPPFALEHSLEVVRKLVHIPLVNGAEAVA